MFVSNLERLFRGIIIRKDTHFSEKLLSDGEKLLCLCDISRTATEKNYNFTIKKWAANTKSAAHIVIGVYLDDTLFEHRLRNLHKACNVGTLDIVDSAVGLLAVAHARRVNL